MTLVEILKSLDALTDEELLTLGQQIQQRTSPTLLRAGTMDVDVLLSAVQELTEGLSPEQLKIMTAAMNTESVNHRFPRGRLKSCG